MKIINLSPCLICIIILCGCSEKEIDVYECEITLSESANIENSMPDSKDRKYTSQTIIKIDRNEKQLEMNGISCVTSFNKVENIYKCKVVNSDIYKQFVKVEFDKDDLSLKLDISSLQRAYGENKSFLDLTKVNASGLGFCELI